MPFPFFIHDVCTLYDECLIRAALKRYVLQHFCTFLCKIGGKTGKLRHEEYGTHLGVHLLRLRYHHKPQSQSKIPQPHNISDRGASSQWPSGAATTTLQSFVYLENSLSDSLGPKSGPKRPRIVPVDPLRECFKHP
jgi:hypothetical protein